MPTGYTADIKDGISFKTFALNCARAFGACVLLRDEPAGGDQIPDEFTPSDYHSKAAQKAREELAHLLTLTPAQRNQCANKAWDDAETARMQMLDERRKTREAYEVMLAQVDAWSPPTGDHAGLQDFMRDQIQQSIKFDCGGEYGTKPTPRLTGGEWAASESARLNRDIGYHEAAHAEECQRAADRTKWVRDLRGSLEGGKAVTP